VKVKEHKTETPTPAQLERFLAVMDKAAPGSVRTAIPLGIDEDGEPFGLICWRLKC
jgi:hypothetical protein